MGNMQKFKNTDFFVCVYNLQIIHNAEKSAQQGVTLNYQECKTDTLPSTLTPHRHTYLNNKCDCNTKHVFVNT